MTWPKFQIFNKKELSEKYLDLKTFILQKVIYIKDRDKQTHVRSCNKIKIKIRAILNYFHPYLNPTVTHYLIKISFMYFNQNKCEPNL